MVVVAVAAVLATIEEVRRRGERYKLRAHYHLAASHQLDMDRRTFICGYGMSEAHLEAIRIRREAEWKVAQTAIDYHDRLLAKYRHAAERPWLSVGSDPPPPPEANPKIVTADDY
jgi:hypothetical protein